MDARNHLESLVGKTIPTMTGRPNRVLEVRGGHVLVATERSPQGQPVPVGWVQDALDRLFADSEVEISVESVGHRSAFIGAVLLTVPGARGVTGPRRVILAQGATLPAERSDAHLVRGDESSGIGGERLHRCDPMEIRGALTALDERPQIVPAANWPEGLEA